MPELRANAGDCRFEQAYDSMPMQGDLQPAIRVVMMPKDTNALGTIFGGVILNYVDLAGWLRRIGIRPVNW